MTIPVVRFTVAGVDTSPTSAALGRPFTLVYDGTCKVCGRFVTLLRAWDRNEEIEVVPSQQPGVIARFPWIPARAYAEAVQLIGPHGRTWSGAAAIEHLLHVLPKGRLLSWIFKIPFMRRIADRFYKWFARNRYHFGCGAHCQARPMDVIFREAEEAENK
jgi:predicted DCC family thiol-disulfide oxidoreductase YuxK